VEPASGRRGRKRALLRIAAYVAGTNTQATVNAQMSRQEKTILFTRTMARIAAAGRKKVCKDNEMRPFCARCKEEFPVAKEPTRWAMGQLRPLKKLSSRLLRREGLLSWLGGEFPAYLCGNCYFDLTDY